MASLIFDRLTNGSAENDTVVQWSHTIGSSEGNRGIFVFAWNNRASGTMGTGITATCGGVSMTKLLAAVTPDGITGGAALFVLTGMTAGAKTIQVSFPWTGYIGAWARSYYNVHQSQPYHSGSVDGGYQATYDPSFTIPTRGGGLCIAGLGYSATSPVHTVGAGQTQFVTLDGPGSTYIVTGSTEPGSGSNVTMSWGLSEYKKCVIAGCCINPAGGGKALVFG